MEEGRITGNGWRTEWRSEKDLRLDQQVEMEDNKVEVEEEAGDGVVTERLMTVKAEVTMVDTDSLGRWYISVSTWSTPGVGGGRH